MFVQFHLDGAPPAGTSSCPRTGTGAPLRRGGAQPRGAAAPRRRRPHLGGDGARAAAGASGRGARRGLVARERAAPRQVACRARADGAGVPDRARGDGRDGSPLGPHVTMTSLVEEVEHQLHVRGSRCPSFPTHIFTWGERGSTRAGRPPSTRSRRARSSSSTSAPSRGLLLRLRPHGPPAASRRPATRTRAAACSRPRRRAGRPPRPVRRRARSTPPAGPDRGSRARRGFRHRMGHGIGLDVHERPFLSTEDDTPLEQA